MARDHARVELNIWADDDWLDLTPGAQHLYLVLLTHPDLSYAGVADWRPNRLRAMASHWDTDDVKRAAEELARNLYIVVDEDTEEALVRSFVRNDGLMKQPNLAKAMVKAARSIASRSIRAVLVHELLRLREDHPDLKGWESADELLSWRSTDPSGYPTGYPSSNPSGKGEPNPSDDPSDDPSLTPYSLLPTPYSPLPTPTPAAKAPGGKRYDYSPEFEAFWSTYPLKVSKRQAWNAWGKALNRATVEAITEGARRYADDPNRDAGYTKHAATWLNADGWDDEPLPSRQRQQQQKPQRTWVDVARGMSQQNNYVEATIIEQGELE